MGDVSECSCQGRRTEFSARLPGAGFLPQDELLLSRWTVSVRGSSWLPGVGMSSAFAVVDDHPIDDVPAENTSQRHDPRSSLRDDLRHSHAGTTGALHGQPPFGVIGSLRQLARGLFLLLAGRNKRGEPGAGRGGAAGLRWAGTGKGNLAWRQFLATPCSMRVRQGTQKSASGLTMRRL
jgi:hypothetical protein